MTNPLRWAALAALTVGMAAQAPAPAAGLAQTVIKNRAPVSQQVLQVHLPKPFEAALPNGLTVLIVEDHRLPLVTATLQMDGAGSMFDPPGQAGLASFTAAMMNQGTTTRSAEQFAQQAEDLGATVNVASAQPAREARITASGLARNFDQWFPLAVDVLLHPSFPEDKIGAQKQRTILALRQGRTVSATLAAQRFAAAVFGDFPAGITQSSEAAVNGWNREALERWHDQRYVPQNAILGISGDVTPAALLPQLQSWLAAWAKGGAAAVLNGTPHPAAARQIYLIDRPGSVQTTIYMGNLAIAHNSPDYFPLLVLNQVFGAGAQSRLFMNLREKRGLTYGVNSNIAAASYPGPWRAYGNFRTEVTGQAMEQMLFEVNRIRDQKVPPAELADAQRGLAAGFARSLENPSTVLDDFIQIRTDGLPSNFWDSYTAKIMAVTPDDVQRVARQYMVPASLQVVAVGDGAKIKADLEPYGPVAVYGTDGKPVGAISTMPVLDQSTMPVLDQSTMPGLDQDGAVMAMYEKYPDFGHGTAVLGLIHLVAPQARLMPVKAFGPGGDGDLASILSGIYYATDLGASVINMSFSATTPSNELGAAIAYAYGRGVALVASAGNDGASGKVYPGSLPNVLNTAAVDGGNNLASFSNYGPAVSVAAPGVAANANNAVGHGLIQVAAALAVFGLQP